MTLKDETSTDYDCPPRISVLIVDDDFNDRYFCKRFLESSSAPSYEVHEVEYASETLAILESTSIDCVLLDNHLPDINGIDILALLRQQHPEIPVVVLTGLDDKSVERTALEKGASGYVPKNELSTDILVSQISQALGNTQDDQSVDPASNEARIVESKVHLVRTSSAQSEITYEIDILSETSPTTSCSGDVAASEIVKTESTESVNGHSRQITIDQPEDERNRNKEVLLHPASAIARIIYEECLEYSSTQPIVPTIVYEESESLRDHTVLLNTGILCEAFGRLVNELATDTGNPTLYYGHTTVDSEIPLVVFKIGNHALSSTPETFVELTGFRSSRSEDSDYLILSNYFCQRVVHRIGGYFSCVKMPDSGVIYSVAVPAMKNGQLS